MWPILVVVGVAVVGLVGGLVLLRQSPEVTPGAGSESASPMGLALSTDGLSLPTSSSAQQWRGVKDLSGAIEASRPEMADTIDRLDEGAAEFALWASEHLTWKALSNVPETTPALYRKDPAEERGKRLCAQGTITEVRAERDLSRRLLSDHLLPLPAPTPATLPAADAGLLGVDPGARWDVPGGKVFFAIVDTKDPSAKTERGEEQPLVVSAIAVGSTGQLVDGDRGRVCGVLTGVNLIKGNTRTDILAHRVVGMFDLPENRAEKP